MKANYFLFFILVSFYAIACGSSNQNKNANVDSSLIKRADVISILPEDSIIRKVVCASDPSMSYALYIPSSKDTNPLPVVYFFDPHGDGLLPVKKYKSLADTFHFILAGSNNSKNGNNLDDAGNIFTAMKEDLGKRTKVNPNRIYLCGFSGGAKVATYLALHFPEIKGIIANGAGLEDITHAGDFTFSYTAIAGEGDLNMTDLAAIDNLLDKTNTRHSIIYFDGIHEWAPESTMAVGFDGWQLQAMRDKIIPPDTAFIHRFATQMKQIIDEKINRNQLIQAQQNCKLGASMLQGFQDEQNWFVQKENSIAQASLFQQQKNQRQQLLATEEKLKYEYQQQFADTNHGYWEKTIKEVKAKAKLKNAEARMYQRLQAYLSLAFYSISNQMINRDENKVAEFFVMLYKMADPTNSEAWYFSAILDARNHDAEKTTKDLEKAIALGFNDTTRLMQQPEFAKENLDIRLNDIAKQMK
jgi:pimeloyl-ACP methyl ester carboxylesterase